MQREKMPEVLDFPPKAVSLLAKNMVENVASSYEAEIENIDFFFETTHLILSEFQEPLLNAKQERDRISAQLQDMLAKNEHLRRTDFNHMMQGIFSIQFEKEKEIKNLLNSYFTEQKETIFLLRNSLTKIKESLVKAEGIEAKECKEFMNKILTQQDKRKQEVSSKLKEFQKEQQEMTKRLIELLSKGRELRIKDLKSMLREFQAEHKKRLAQQEERKAEVQKRREDVRGMLVECKKKRRDSTKNQRSNSPKAILPVGNVKEDDKEDKVSNGVNIDN